MNTELRLEQLERTVQYLSDRTAILDCVVRNARLRSPRLRSALWLLSQRRGGRTRLYHMHKAGTVLRRAIERKQSIGAGDGFRL